MVEKTLRCMRHELSLAAERIGAGHCQLEKAAEEASPSSSLRHLSDVISFKRGAIDNPQSEPDRLEMRGEVPQLTDHCPRDDPPALVAP